MDREEALFCGIVFVLGGLLLIWRRKGGDLYVAWNEALGMDVSAHRDNVELAVGIVGFVFVVLGFLVMLWWGTK